MTFMAKLVLMRSIKDFFVIFLCFFMISNLAACGSKGDLYQPEEEKVEQKNQIKVLKQGVKTPKKQS